MKNVGLTLNFARQPRIIVTLQNNSRQSIIGGCKEKRAQHCNSLSILCFRANVAIHNEWLQPNIYERFFLKLIEPFVDVCSVRCG
ncbi:unnamed protein product, partial [Vitis vinifera]|uniref:Uncharacterized protein n=1 Tax=Vitis vinifera TaxID=29760 RepID=D7UDF4_VITVI